MHMVGGGWGWGLFDCAANSLHKDSESVVYLRCDADTTDLAGGGVSWHRSERIKNKKKHLNELKIRTKKYFFISTNSGLKKPTQYKSSF